MEDSTQFGFKEAGDDFQGGPEFLSKYAIDGAPPDSGLVVDKAGNLYGTTSSGGTSLNYGIVYEISPQGEESILHSFGLNIADGAKPIGNLVMDSAGNLYGTTSGGGTGDSGIAGTIFKVTP